MKRILATWLAVALLLSVMATAFADGIEVGEDAVLQAPEADEEQVEIVPEDDDGLILGDDLLADAGLELAESLDLEQATVESGADAAGDGAAEPQLQGNAVGWKGHYYRVIDASDIGTEVDGWDMAEAFCEYLGGYLATITSAEEDAFVFNNVLLASGYESAYFGLTDEEEEGHWRWVSGEPFEYSNWADGEPNNQGGIEHYGLYYWKNSDGKWNDGDFSGSPAFICEWDDYSGQDNYLDFVIEDGVLTKYKGNSSVVRIPKGVKEIGNEVFYGDNTIKEVIIPEGVKIIGYHAFESCASLKKVSLPQSLTEIEDYAFWNCVSLTAVKIPGKTKTIGKEAFYECESLTSITLSKGVTGIGDKAFYNTAVSSIVVPDSVKRMGNYAFARCKQLNNVILSEGMTDIGAGVFSSCTRLKSVILPDKLSSVGESAFQYTGLSEVVLPGTVNSIGAFAYANCDKLKAVVIPPSVHVISEDAFDQSDPYIYCKPGSYADSFADDQNLPTQDIRKATPTGVTITKGKSATAYVGRKLTLKAKLKPSKAKTKLKWSSSKPKVAAVSKKGVVTPKKAGKTVVTVRTANGKKARITIKVIDAKSVKLKEGKAATLKVGKKLTLHAKVTPTKVVTKLTWTTSNKKVATVTSKGVVKAINPGKAVITVRTANGKKAKLTVTVK